MLFLSKRNTIISDFIFPFETINMDFISFYKELIKKLPIDLSIKKFRHYIPTKDWKKYNVKKLSLDELKMFEELIIKNE
jgi:hypothetical protein